MNKRNSLGYRNSKYLSRIDIDYNNISDFLKFTEQNLNYAYTDLKLEKQDITTVYVIDAQEVFAYVFKDFTKEEKNSLIADDLAAVKFFEDQKEYFTFLDGTWYEIIKFISSMYDEFNNDKFKGLLKFFNGVHQKWKKQEWNYKEIFIEELSPDIAYTNAMRKLLSILQSNKYFEINDVDNEKDYYDNILYGKIVDLFNSDLTFTRKKTSNRVDASNVAGTIALNKLFMERYNAGQEKKQLHFCLLTHTQAIFGLNDIIANITRDYDDRLSASVIKSPVNVDFQRTIKQIYPNSNIRFNKIQQLQKKCLSANHELDCFYYKEDDKFKLRINSLVLSKGLTIEELELMKQEYKNILIFLEDKDVSSILNSMKRLTKDGRIRMRTISNTDMRIDGFFLSDVLRFKNIIAKVFYEISNKLDNSKIKSVKNNKLLENMKITEATIETGDDKVIKRVFTNIYGIDLINYEYFLEKRMYSLYWDMNIGIEEFVNIAFKLIWMYHDDYNENDKLYYYLVERDDIPNIYYYSPNSQQYYTDKFNYANVIRINCPEFALHIDYKMFENDPPQVAFLSMTYNKMLIEDVILNLSNNYQLLVMLDKIIGVHE